MLSTGYLSDLNPWYHATLDVEVLEQARRVEQWLSKRVGRGPYLLSAWLLRAEQPTAGIRLAVLVFGQRIEQGKRGGTQAIIVGFGACREDASPSRPRCLPRLSIPLG